MSFSPIFELDLKKGLKIIPFFVSALSLSYIYINLNCVDIESTVPDDLENMWELLGLMIA